VKRKRTVRRSSGHAIGAWGGLEHRRWMAIVEALGFAGLDRESQREEEEEERIGRE
jgi:hypothetical protein